MKDAKGHGSDPRGGAAHQQGVNGVGLSRYIDVAGKPVEVLVNPSVSVAERFAKEPAIDPYFGEAEDANSLRVLRDNKGNVFLWHGNEAIHSQVINKLGIDRSTLVGGHTPGDLWMVGPKGLNADQRKVLRK